jgi:nicotinamidase-related amidase
MNPSELKLLELLTVDEAAGTIQFKHRRMLLLDADAMGLLRKELVETLGAERARRILIRFGYACGYRDALTSRALSDWPSVAEWWAAGPRLHTLEGAAYALARIPTFTTASVPDGPNGPLIPEIHQYNPDAVYIPRTGQINAWDNPAWVKAIEETKRKTLLIAGTLTSVCMSFPTLSALVAGYKVFTIVDASGNWSQIATDITVDRVAQAGAMPIDTYAVLAELMSTWNRPDAMEFAQVMVDHIVPPYRALMESYDKAQSVQKGGRETKLDLRCPAHMW